MVIELKATLVVALIAIACGAVLELLIRLRQPAVVGWVKRHRPESWRALSRTPRWLSQWFDYSAAIGGLKRGRNIDDPMFHAQINKLRRLEICQAVAILVLLASGSLFLLGWPAWSFSIEL